ncbi:helix-turn-helix domain-containing protein [Lactobacillus sp. AN1001]
MKEFGKVFKHFRESKNMSLREVAGKTTSASQISRFERGHTGINVETFYHCLHTMNISMHEFENKYNEYNHIDDFNYNIAISEAYLEKNISKLTSILHNELKSDKKAARLNSIVIKIAIFMCDDSKKVHKKDIEYLSDYLFSIDDWGKYEIWLFSNSLFALPSKSLAVLGSEIVSSLHFHKNSEEYRRKVYITLLNIINCFLERDNLDLALKFLNYFENTNIPESELYIKIFYKYAKSIYLYKTGKISSLNDLNKIIGFLEFIDCFDSAEKMKCHLQQLQISNKNS